MKISKNKFVAVAYDLNVGQDDERELMERATEEHPLEFIFGTETMLPAFEENIKGLEKGSTFMFSLAPENAYGEYIGENVVDVPKNIFEVNGKFDDECVKEGVILPMMNSNGERMHGAVLEVKDNVVVMDFNHPLAGETLHFSGEVVDVHDPTEEEIAAVNRTMSGGCGCGCGECGDQGCEGGCGDHDCDCGCNH
ncbi:MAG: FKBP-type peptidyl-prolyl cis-trans isomerase [Tannerella sp.]|jgi:FKBP-type peptidyl-prolyl cis-trans isomerase SlyD|nr:FKBP-type peptidyl-prolyl cis-trans isomerase [Tannerella sp.]